MVTPIPTEVIPIWYIKKWKRENADSGSALDYFLEQLIKDWHREENWQSETIRMKERRKQDEKKILIYKKKYLL